MRKLAYSLRFPRLIRFLFLGVCPAFEHASVLRRINLDEVDFCFDVGANRGQFALLFSDISSVPIYCFEPLTDACATFRRLIRKKNISLFPVALGDHPQTLELNIASSSDSSSFLDITYLQEQIYSVTGTQKTTSVPVCTLQSFLDHLDAENAFLKIDVQGFELSVLMGCVNLSHFFKYIYLEVSFVPLYAQQPLFSHIHHHLERSGYRVCDFANLDARRGVGAVQADFLYIRV